MNKNILNFMGNTPIIKLQKITNKEASDIYVKLEEFNPGGSIKSRIALQMVLDAEDKKILQRGSGQTLLEPTGGNTGTGLAMIGAIHGYKVVLVIPDNYSKEKIKILKTYGANIILSDSKTGNDSHIKKAKQLINEHNDYIWLDQLTNQSNPKAHYENTGREILESIKKVDCFITGIGSGGTITGVGKRIKEKFPDAQIVAVQPAGCDVLAGKAIPHKIQGFAIGTLPTVLDVNIIDNVLSIEYEEAIYYMKAVASQEGLLIGISSGANVCGAVKMADMLGKGKTIVTIAPDGGRSYMEVFKENNSKRKK